MHDLFLTQSLMPSVGSVYDLQVMTGADLTKKKAAHV